MKTYTVLLADDHALIRAGLHHLLQSFQIYTVVGEAGDGLQTIELALTLQPDVVLLDLAMPKMRGIEAIQEIKRVSPPSKILVLSMHDRDEYVRQALKTGADGYLLKGSGTNELRSALHDILEDRIYLSPSISKNIISEWILNKGVAESENESLPLTAREKGVLKLLAEGHPNKEIANLLHISVKTVETHRSRIMEKSDSHNLAELVKYAIKIGIVDL